MPSSARLPHVLVRAFFVLALSCGGLQHAQPVHGQESAKDGPAVARADARAHDTTGGTENVGIGVFIYNSASVPADVLERSKQVVAGIYQDIGVAVTWLERRGRRLTDADTLTSMIAVRLVGRGTRADAATAVMGRAVVGGRIVEAFYHRLVRVSRSHRADVACVLGHVIAHEIGHVLLRREAHSPTGIMHPELNVRLADRGELFFTPDQGVRIRRLLTSGRPDMFVRADP